MSGGRYEAGKEYDDFLHGYACTFRDMPREKYRDYLGFAIWYYGGYDFPAMQLIYPDRYHRWPWEEGVHEEFRRRQPVIDMAQGA